MPTILRKDGYRFFFFSNERNEPAHIHVECGDGIAKFWLDPVELAYASRLSKRQLSKILNLVTTYQLQFKASWHAYFD